MMQTDNINQWVNQEICDCDQRCAKCGKLKRQNEQAFPQPYSPYLPIQPLNPYFPGITYTTSTYPCTPQE